MTNEAYFESEKLMDNLGKFINKISNENFMLKLEIQDLKKYIKSLNKELLTK